MKLDSFSELSSVTYPWVVNNLVEDMDSCETDGDMRQLWQNIDIEILIPMLARGGKNM